MSAPSPPELNRRLQAGMAAFQRGDYAAAWQTLSPLDHPQALNVAAVSAQKTGHWTLADQAFTRALTLAPHNPDILNNRGHFDLARGQFASAEAAFDKALRHAPTSTPAAIGRAKVLAARNDWPAAAEAWRKVLATTPKSVTGRYGLYTALLESGEAEAARDGFQSLLADRGTAEVHFMLGRALLECDAYTEATTHLEASYGQAPAPHSFRVLANLYWMQGQTERFTALLDTAPPSLTTLSIQLRLETGDTEAADAAWQRHFGPSGEPPMRQPDADAWALAALIARQANDPARAALAADRAIALNPGHPAALDTRIAADLMSGQPRAALARLAPLRRTAPHAQHWIAHGSVAERLLGQDDPSTAIDPSPITNTDRFVRAYQIAPPDGFSDLAAFNAALAETIRALHKFSVRPLDQSLRGGTQTTRSLDTLDDPVLKAYVAALDGPIRQYLSDIGTGPDHPTSARNTGNYKIAGMWSVRLTGKGYHENHVHPDGWISSAYYVEVPPGTADAPDKAGWIGFGAPPYPTSPPLEPLKWVAPTPGTLVLFPSFMWHGTRPIADAAERITAPFDLLPA